VRFEFIFFSILLGLLYYREEASNRVHGGMPHVP
jgi:hypothetical protein